MSNATPDPLPHPTGPNAVGRVSYEWVDQERAEIYSADVDDRREVVVWVWYPAVTDAGAARADYLPAAWAPNAEFLGLDVARVLAHSVEDAPLADGVARYPVLLMSLSGFPPLMHSSLAEELASHGYVVVGVNHTYESQVTAFRDGRVVPASAEAVAGALGPQSGSHDETFRARAGVCIVKATDLAFVADEVGLLDADPNDRFGGRLDLSRMGAFGLSFGGNAALEWCRTDPRCNAAVNLDGALWSDVGKVGLERPVLQVLSEHQEFAISPEKAVETGMAPDVEWFVAEKALTFGGWRTVHERSRPGYTVRVAGATHLSFLDVPLLPRKPDAMVAGMLAATTIGAERMSRIISDLVLAFFGRHLGAGDGELLDGPGAAYPELTYGPA